MRWFEDPRCRGGGEKTVAGSDQGLYWAVESRIKRAESRRRTTIGVVGELVAIRRSAFRRSRRTRRRRPLDGARPDRGGRISATSPRPSVEAETPSLAIEWDRRTRTQAGRLDLLWRRRRLLAPGSPVATELWGHKLFEPSSDPLARAPDRRFGRLFRRSRLARVFAGGHPLGALALAALAWPPVPRPARLAAHPVSPGHRDRGAGPLRAPRVARGVAETGPPRGFARRLRRAVWAVRGCRS